MKFTYEVNILRLLSVGGINIVVIQTIKGIIMNTHKIFLHCIRTISFISILAVLSIGFILPISIAQALVINPVILFSLMVIFALSNEKVKLAKQLANIVTLPGNSK
jgi:hypothetical protein